MVDINEIDDKVNGEAREHTLGQKLELQYPCEWRYKLIGKEMEVIEKAVREVLSERDHKIDFSNASCTGKYCSMNLDLLVHNDDERQFIYETLKAHQDIKMVL